MTGNGVAYIFNTGLLQGCAAPVDALHYCYTFKGPRPPPPPVIFDVSALELISHDDRKFSFNSSSVLSVKRTRDESCNRLPSNRSLCCDRVTEPNFSLTSFAGVSLRGKYNLLKYQNDSKFPDFLAQQYVVSYSENIFTSHPFCGTNREGIPLIQFVLGKCTANNQHFKKLEDSVSCDCMSRQ